MIIYNDCLYRPKEQTKSKIYLINPISSEPNEKLLKLESG